MKSELNHTLDRHINIHLDKSHLVSLGIGYEPWREQNFNFFKQCTENTTVLFIEIAMDNSNDET